MGGTGVPAYEAPGIGYPWSAEGGAVLGGGTGKLKPWATAGCAGTGGACLTSRAAVAGGGGKYIVEAGRWFVSGDEYDDRAEGWWYDDGGGKGGGMLVSGAAGAGTAAACGYLESAMCCSRGV